MQVTYSHANPQHGNESFLIRFRQKGHQQTPVLLVDSGKGVNVSSLLEDNEYLLGILLTHAHSDHYQTLPQNIVDGAKVYTSPDTAAILPEVIRDGIQNGVKGSVSTVTKSLVPIEEWTELLNNVRVKPIPAGHCPGASGFLLQFKSDGDWQSMVITGDFTLSDSAGYPGFPLDMLVDTDALFLTGTATTTDERVDAIEAAYEHAISGSRTLVTATGLMGVELAYQMGHLFSQNNISIPVRIVGHGAKLYNNLGYDVPGVTAVEKFKRTEPVMDAGAITISGPQSPTEGSSGRLFGAIRNDTKAALIQVMNNATTPVSEGRCTIRSFTYIAHPTQEEIDEVVETLDPVQVVITHQSKRAGDRYKDKYTSYVWAPSDTKQHVLFNRNTWQSPPWVTEQGNQLIKGHHSKAATNSIDISGDVPTPSIAPTGQFTPQAEGFADTAFSQLTRSTPQYKGGNGVPSDTEPVTETVEGPDSQSLPAPSDPDESSDSNDDAEQLVEATVQEAVSPEQESEWAESHEIDGKLFDVGDGQAILKFDDATDVLKSVQSGSTVSVRITSK